MSISVTAGKHAQPVLPAASHGVRPQADSGGRHAVGLPGDRASRETHSATYRGVAKALGKANETEPHMKALLMWGLLGSAAISIGTIAIGYTIQYFIQKAAVHKGIVEAARQGVIGSAQNRINANNA